MTGKTILVVGGAGYIGSHICKALADRGDIPVVFDNLSSGHKHAVQWGPFVLGDIRNATDLYAVFDSFSFDGVMHFAAHIEVGEGEIHPIKFWNNNVGGTALLLKAMRDAGVLPFVFSSTCATYGEPQTLPLTENEPQTPMSVYGRTKLAVEWLLKDAQSAGQLHYAALRYFNAAGASPTGEIGEEHDPETHLIPNALKAAAGLGGPMKLFGNDYATRDGTCVRDYVHVSDLADAHLAALDRIWDKKESFVCNLGSGHGFTVGEILSTVEEGVGRPVPFSVHPRRAGDVPTLLADTRRAKEILNFNPTRSTPEKVVSDAWNFHKRRWFPNMHS